MVCISLDCGSLGVRILVRSWWIFLICGSCMCSVCLRRLFRYAAHIVCCHLFVQSFAFVVLVGSGGLRYVFLQCDEGVCHLLAFVLLSCLGCFLFGHIGGIHGFR